LIETAKGVKIGQQKPKKLQKSGLVLGLTGTISVLCVRVT